eukprot:PITA_20287
MIQQEKPSLVFLQETKGNSNSLEKILNKVWTSCCLVSVDSLGTSGGLAILWNPQILSLQDFHASHFFISTTFHLIGTNIHGLLTNVYFPQDLQKKLDVLNSLTNLSSGRRHPLWISGGAYNIITVLEEKSGGREKLEEDSTSFKEFIARNQLMDLQTSNDNAIHLGGDFHASILPQAGSDHWPIMLQWSRPESKSNKPFRFESFWFSHPNLKEVVTAAWKSFTPPVGAKMFQFQKKIKYLKQALKTWNRTQFGNIFDERKVLEQQMNTLQQCIISEGRKEEYALQEKTLQNQIETQREQEDTLWRQKSKIRWLRDGEKNTKLFHRLTIQRRMHNNIAFINNQQGEKLEKHEDIVQEFQEHF